MINYLDKISLDFFNTSNPDLDFLRWIIAKKYEKDSTFLESLIKNNYKKLYPEPANISSKDYEKRIYQYALEEIPNSIHSQQTEYAFLLYFYAKLYYASYKGSLKNNILDYIIPYVRNVNVTPVAGKPIPDSELESYLKEATSTKYYLNALSLTDRIIFILYLWITDMCFSAQYLTEKKICCCLPAIHILIFPIHTKITYGKNGRHLLPCTTIFFINPTHKHMIAYMLILSII